MNTHNGLRTEAQGKPNIVTDGVGEVCRHGHVMGGDDASRFLPSLIHPSNLPAHGISCWARCAVRPRIDAFSYSQTLSPYHSMEWYVIMMLTNGD